MKESERAVSYYDLFMESRARGQPEKHPRPVPVNAALAIAYEKWSPGPFSNGSGPIKVTLADWKRAGRDHLLLFNRADASLPDIPLRHLDSGSTRMAGKELREGIDISCHVLIREHVDQTKAALMLLTNGSSLSTDKMCQILGTLFRSANHDVQHVGHFRRPHPSGAIGQTVGLHSHFGVGGHQNATLASLLSGGRLEGLELIAETPPQLDEASILDVKSVQYTLEPVGKGRIGVAAILSAVTQIRKKGMDPTKARVRYRPPGMDRAESHTFEIGALEQTFVRREIIRFMDPIAARYQAVETRVARELQRLAERELPG